MFNQRIFFFSSSPLSLLFLPLQPNPNIKKQVHFFASFSSLLQFNPLPQRKHPTDQNRAHNHRRINGGHLTPLYVALKMPVPAAALTISTMANAAQDQTKQQQIGASKGQWWQSKERWRSRLLQAVGLGRNGRSSGSGRAFPGLAMRQIEESLDRCHVGDAVCGGGDAQPRETTLTAGAAFSCLRRHSRRDVAPRDAGVACA